MKKFLALTFTFSMLVTAAHAQMRGEDPCDSNSEDCAEEGEAKEPLKTIYPYKPFSTREIQEKLEKLTENKNYLWDIREMDRRGLTRANTNKQPWGSSFWPLFQGMVANTYQAKDNKIFITTLLENLSWKENVGDYKRRKPKIQPNIYNLDEKELARLAPSEKYDILMGDTSFDLTNRVWKYVENWGREKQWGNEHLVYINFQEVEKAGESPENYRAPKPNDYMALWEGICHGWALGAGLSPRPQKTVEFTLPNGRRLPFFASDVKALVSLMWANNDIQDYTLFEGNKCNKKNPDKDKFGRYIDIQKDTFLDPSNSADPIPRCADVHPAVFHVSMLNILGLEGRSFVIDHNPKSPVANQPVAGYEFDYFNPQSGKKGTLNETMISVAALGDKDIYRISRNPETAYIVGVSMNVKFIDWELPKKQATSKPEDDKVKDFKFKYDLEINANGKIVGGQWRAKAGGGTNQPDYFWVAPRDWKKFFPSVGNLPEWKGTGLPPKEYRDLAVKSPDLHSYVRFENRECPVFPVKGNGPMLKVNCRHKFSRPRPVTQIIHKLLELSAGSAQ